MRIVYLVVGSLALLLGVIGVLLPVLPTTPFLLLAVFCYARSSEAFEKWLRSSKLYQLYVADYAETRTIPKARKKRIACQILLLMGISIFFAPIIWVKVGLVGLLIFILYYLFYVIPDREE
ncbi:YbaN family protein [Streptococcus gallinaceus]|uniref:Uncharacterized membrane protein YbaN (DUF454 family) n=1 Tax=Streptococcus gallinaceus TaxID=165758 RepID=A0ABV2JJG9_9STRE|nr:YbaN family protein [Streptococcus gallinaceus]MCP1638965.1 uncharacterized membrane protein YbaN (DUF454 family) [Streptococcus gallinaceus]MCP1769791.1 uncharacterized membrane protein YbaN (DUF454 family) [Streptococcus gallinaceus]